MQPLPPQDFLTLDDIVRALWGRWFRILCMTCFLTVIVLAIALCIPNRYQSDALLYVRMGRGTVSLDPASTAAGQTISLMDRRQSEINSVREMLRSRVVLDRAVRQVGVDRVLAEDAWWNVAIDSASQWLEDQTNSLQDKYLKSRLVNKEVVPTGFTAQEFKAQEELELAVKRLSKSLSIDAAKDSYTIGVYVRAYNPELARDLCEAVVNEYRKVHVEAHMMEGSLKFFEEEYALVERRLSDLEAKLRDEKNRTAMMTISGKQDLIHQEIRQLQADRLKASAELAAAQGRDAEFMAKIGSLPEKLDIEKTAGVGNAATDTMRNQLFELEMLEKELVGKYSGDHPLVVQVRKKLKEARNIFDDQEDERVLSRQSINPIRQELELDRLRNLTALEGWKAQMEEINDKLKLAQDKAAQLNNDELNINELERNVQLARADVLTYGRKREEARLLKQLDVGNFSDISVPQPPMLVYKHVSPPRGLLLALGAVGSFGLSCCLAVWRGAPNRQRPYRSTDATTADARRVTAQATESVSQKPSVPKSGADAAAISPGSEKNADGVATEELHRAVSADSSTGTRSLVETHR